MIVELWRNRCRPPRYSRKWLKRWAKRVWTLPSLFLFSLRAGRLRSRGATVAASSLVSQLRVSGKHHLLSIGDESFVGRAEIHLHAAIEIGSRACINDGVALLTASHDVTDPKWRQIAKPIWICDYAWIATGAVILPGVRVGRGAVIGAGSVVAKDVPDYGVAVGNPAKVREGVRTRDLHYSPVDFAAFRSAWLGDVPVGIRPQ